MLGAWHKIFASSPPEARSTSSTMPLRGTDIPGVATSQNFVAESLHDFRHAGGTARRRQLVHVRGTAFGDRKCGENQRGSESCRSTRHRHDGQDRQAHRLGARAERRARRRVYRSDDSLFARIQRCGVQSRMRRYRGPIVSSGVYVAMSGRIFLMTTWRKTKRKECFRQPESERADMLDDLENVLLTDQRFPFREHFKKFHVARAFVRFSIQIPLAAWEMIRIRKWLNPCVFSSSKPPGR